MGTEESWTTYWMSHTILRMLKNQLPKGGQHVVHRKGNIHSVFWPVYEDHNFDGNIFISCVSELKEWIRKTHNQCLLDITILNEELLENYCGKKEAFFFKPQVWRRSCKNFLFVTDLTHSSHIALFFVQCICHERRNRKCRYLRSDEQNGKKNKVCRWRGITLTHFCGVSPEGRNEERICGRWWCFMWIQIHA